MWILLHRPWLYKCLSVADKLSQINNILRTCCSNELQWKQKCKRDCNKVWWRKRAVAIKVCFVCKSRGTQRCCSFFISCLNCKCRFYDGRRCSGPLTFLSRTPLKTCVMRRLWRIRLNFRSCCFGWLKRASASSLTFGAAACCKRRDRQETTCSKFECDFGFDGW